MKRILIMIAILIGSLSIAMAQPTQRIYIAPELQNCMEEEAPLCHKKVSLMSPVLCPLSPLLQEILHSEFWNHGELMPATRQDYRPFNLKGRREDIGLPTLTVKNR